jgi:MFS family permease
MTADPVNPAYRWVIVFAAAAMLGISMGFLVNGLSVQTVLVFGFTQFTGLQAFYVFAAIYGFGYGGVMTGVLTATRELTPSARRAAATGIVLAFAWLGHGLGGWQGGLFYDLTGGYGVFYANAALAGVVNLAIMGSLFAALGRQR